MHHLSELNAVFAGFSGVSRLGDKQHMQELLSSLVNYECDVYVDNDAVTALYSGTLGQPGIVQISGTGPITYGINQRGVHECVCG
ncbi:BadF/BadG/BcrA/BcrD ATPase family protein [Virgibacillus pantothenticus]|uniref:BadF/BadG/BcrA/BcrD ATPase family protein n=2 Tax=Bacillaceae TaxID=186817 RepID=UPI002E2342FB